LFVSGPAGIGKTRFCEELVEQTEAEGWSVLRSAGRQQTAAVPFWPIVEAVQAVMVERPYLANALADADRALLTRLAGFGADQPSAPVHRHAVLHLVANLVAAMGAPRSLLFLDDLHNVDDDTLALAEVLAAAPAPRGIVLVATYRTGTGERESAMARSTVARGFGAEVTLHPLRRADTDAVVGEALGRPASEADRELAWQLSEGNPFFALEVAAALSSDEAAGGSGAYGAIDIRLQRLPAGTLELLRSVAVVAYEFSADEFAALGGVDADGALEHLQVALGEGVIARQASSYRYRHDLVRDRLTEGVTPAERAAAHAAAAGRLAALAAPAARIAHHLLAAGSPEESLPWLRRAAADAMTVGAYADALMAANRALQVAPGDPPMLALRADALNALGEPGAAAAYSLAMAVSSEPERAALAVRRAKALIMAGDIPAAMDTLGSVRSVPAEARAQLEVARGLACWCTGALDDAEEAGRQAKRLAEETGQLRDFVDATMVLAMVAHERGGWPQRLSLDMLDPTIAPDLAAVVIDAHLCVAESYLYGGVPYADVIQFASELRRDAADSAAPRAEAFATTLLGEAHLLMGDAETAAGYLRAAAEQHQRVGVLCGEALSLQRLAEAALAQGDQSQARSALSGALMAARGSPLGTRHLLHRVYGTAVRAAADSQIALAAVDEAARAVRGPSEACPPCSITFTVPATIACASAGDLERATAYLTAAEQVAAAFYPRGGWPAALDEARGYVALANGDGDSALRLFSGAADAFTHLGQALDASRCRDQLAALNGGGKVSGRSGS
jgi:tetratricopeptide (TPR) repeat protein